MHTCDSYHYQYVKGFVVKGVSKKDVMHHEGFHAFESFFQSIHLLEGQFY